MAAIIKLVTLSLFLGLIGIAKGSGHCSLRDIGIGQTQTGAKVEGKPEWRVNVSNNCVCTQLQVKLNCNGFQTAEAIDPSVLGVASDGECLLQNGQPIFGFNGFSFKYAWDSQFPFQPNSSEICCS